MGAEEEEEEEEEEASAGAPVKVEGTKLEMGDMGLILDKGLKELM